MQCLCQEREFPHPPLKCGIVQPTVKKLILGTSVSAPGSPAGCLLKAVEGAPLCHEDMSFLLAESPYAGSSKT